MKRKEPNPDKLVGVSKVASELGVSLSTVWRMIRRGDLPSLRQAGRRVVPRAEVAAASGRTRRSRAKPFTLDHPMWRLAGAYRSGKGKPDSSDKHAILDE